MSLKVLVTGAGGFIGSRLVPFLRSRGHAVTAGEFDLLDFAATGAVLAGESPEAPKSWDAVIHLAAISHVPTCEKDPALAFKTNLAGTAQLVEGMRRHCPSARLIFSSTAQVYAAPSREEAGGAIIMDEQRRIAPQNLYARTKWEAELLIADAAARGELSATVLRLFNHSHKSQSPDFFLPHLYQALLAQPATVPVGNLELSRDIGSIQDLLEAFGALLGRTDFAGLPRHELFNICSGQAKRLSTLAQGLAQRLGSQAQFVVDPSRLRAGEAEVLRGSHERLTQATGWRPRCLTEGELLDCFLAE